VSWIVSFEDDSFVIKLEVSSCIFEGMLSPKVINLIQNKQGREDNLDHDISSFFVSLLK